MVSESSRSSLSPAGPPAQLHLPVGNIYWWKLLSPLSFSSIYGLILSPSGAKKQKKTKQKKTSLHYGHELGKSPENSEGQGSLVHCSSWCCEESDITWQLNTTTTYPGLIHSLLLITDPIPSRT